jgi:hypothetical protein
MKMKLLKSKIVAGVVVVGMVASMGTVFAATNAGAQLQSWYNTASGFAKDAIAGNLASEYGPATAAHATAVGELKGQAQRDIRDAGNAELASVNGSINGQVTTYANQINAAQTEITNNMPAEFDGVVSETNATTDAAIDAIGVSNAQELTNAIRNHKNTYLNRLNNGVATTHTAAVTALNAEIATTKSELNALLAGEQDAATTEVIANLNEEIATLEAELATLTANGVAEAEGAIATQGGILEANALAELDAIVQAIE